MSDHGSQAREALILAEQLVERIGGFNGNGVDELGPAATAQALIGVGHALLDIGLWLGMINQTILRGLA